MHTTTVRIRKGTNIAVWDSAHLTPEPPKVGIEITNDGETVVAYLLPTQVDELIRALAVARVALGASK